MVTNRIYEWARTQPAKTAMIHNDRLYSYAAFAQAIEATTNFFDNQNLLAGRTAIVLINSLADAWTVMLGLRSIGLHTICVSSLSAATALNVKDVACIVVIEAEATIHKIEERDWADARVIAVPSALYATVYAGAIRRQSNDTSPFGGHILYASDATGTYKKLLKDGTTDEKRNAYRATIDSFGTDTVYFVANFGLWTNQGFVLPSAIWHAGGCVVFSQTRESASRAFRHGITHTFLTPLMLKDFLTLHGRLIDSVGEFQLIVGGAFVPLDLAKRAMDRLTKNITIIYGSIEHSSRMRARFRMSDDVNWLAPDTNSTFEIVDENGTQCPIGEEGELRVLLRDIDTTSYLDDEETSRKVFREGYFYPGDIAVRRADGRIRILGRSADVLNIAVAPIEQKIREFLGVSAVCVLYFSNSRDGKEELVLAIEANKPPPKPQLDRVAHAFRSFDRLRFAILLELPRAEAGTQKIKRNEVRKIIVGKGARAGGRPN